MQFSVGSALLQACASATVSGIAPFIQILPETPTSFIYLTNTVHQALFWGLYKLVHLNLVTTL